MLILPFAARAEQAAQPADAGQAMPCPHAGMEGGCCGGACAEMQAKGGRGAGRSGSQGRGGRVSVPARQGREGGGGGAAAAKQAQP